MANIDWPSTNGLTTAQQKAEMIAILDRAKELKLNAIIFQVRPGCDALYASKIEPWSEYLAGAMGKAPSPFYDPLTFAIDEAHKRGMELHAWFNPYRARHASAKSPVSEDHISKKQPELVKNYGRYLWLDPGEKRVQDYSLSVVMDVVNRYDVDGIHFDDYFYPYKERAPQGGELDFPDEASWKRSGEKSGLSRDDWRRQNVNVFIERVYKSIKTAKPHVKFGVSPFGIWRPGHPEQIRGFDQYDKLYADARKWLKEGWCDYFAPQLYWRIEPPQQSYPVLLRWWAEQNDKKRLVVPGMNTTGARAWKPEEIVNQISLTRKQSGTGGHIHWNMSALMRNSELRDALKQKVYTSPAVPPAMPWLSKSVPGRPDLTLNATSASATARMRSAKPEAPAYWVLQSRHAGQWTTEVLPGSKREHRFANLPEVVALRSVDRFGALSSASVLDRGNK